LRYPQALTRPSRLAPTPSRRKRMPLLAPTICAMLHVQPPRGPHFCKPDTGM